MGVSRLEPLRVVAGVIVAGVLAGLLSGCASVAGLKAPMLRSDSAALAFAEPAPRAGDHGEIDGLIARYAAEYDVPESLIRRVIVRESGYNPRAHRGPYWGLMQIRYDTAQSMGYRGPASGLLDADTNLRYGVKYLSGAYLVGGGNADAAVSNFASGYYYKAKAKGLLAEVGLD